MTNVAGAGAEQLNWPYLCYVSGDYTGQTLPPRITRAPEASKVNIIIPAGTESTNTLNFSPDAITVVIGVNNTIVWTNDDSRLHTVTSSSVPNGARSFLRCKPDPGCYLLGDSYGVREPTLSPQHTLVDEGNDSSKVLSGRLWSRGRPHRPLALLNRR
jgi:plastocyanin